MCELVCNRIKQILFFFLSIPRLFTFHDSISVAKSHIYWRRARHFPRAFSLFVYLLLSTSLPPFYDFHNAPFLNIKNEYYIKIKTIDTICLFEHKKVDLKLKKKNDL